MRFGVLIVPEYFCEVCKLDSLIHSFIYVDLLIVGLILEVDWFSASSKMMFVIMFVGYERDEGLDVSLVVMSWPSPAAHGVI